ncbi:MAG: B12-binding domain-containing radical SAM protein [Phycisphaerae bacterium]|nr:B12-binding domain-containing radical SAM protein [Phycisphaerae bacterium]
MRIRFITPYYGVKGLRILTLPVLAAEFGQYADVEICDESVEPIDFSPVDVVGISLLVYNAPRGFEIAKRFREQGAKVILGGTYPSLQPDHCLQHADAVVVGELEGLTGRIMHDLERNRLQPVYRNAEPPDVSHMPRPRVDLLKNDRYMGVGYPIEFTRGCPNACGFCVNPYVFRKFRPISLENIARDLSFRDMDILGVDDLNMTGDRDHALRVAKLLEETGNLKWAAEMTLASLDDDELLEAFARSGFTEAYVGIESVNPRALAKINKGFNRVDEYLRVIRKVQSYGIRVGCGMVLGLDGEDKDFYKQMLAFLEESKMTYVTPTYLTYVPGTRPYDAALAAGRILTHDLRAYDGLHPVVQPDGMTVEELNEGLRWFIRRFFGLRSVLKRLPDHWWRNLPQTITHLATNLWFRSWYWMLVRQYGPNRRYLIEDQDLFDRAVRQPYRRHWLWNVTRQAYRQTSGIETERPRDPEASLDRKPALPATSPSG